MKIVGYALVTLGAVALVRGLWLLTPVAGWIGLATVLYVAGHHLSRSGAERRTQPIPTRVSVNSDDPGYVPLEQANRYEVYCDGERLEKVHTADTELGVAWCYMTDPDGMVLLDPEDPSRPWEVQVRGKIEIRARKRADA